MEGFGDEQGEGFGGPPMISEDHRGRRAAEWRLRDEWRLLLVNKRI